MMGSAGSILDQKRQGVEWPICELPQRINFFSTQIAQDSSQDEALNSDFSDMILNPLRLLRSVEYP
jgi:hypothetical protein